MRDKTRLEVKLNENMHYAFIRASVIPAEIQKVLDRVGNRVCVDLDPLALIEHNRIVYEETAHQYTQNVEHGYIPDALLSFMKKLHNDDTVLDIGCGSGRDAVFMALRDRARRKRFMGRMLNGKTTYERFGVPSKSFFTLGIDASPSMIRSAIALAETNGFTYRGPEAPRAEFLCEIADMHMLSSVETAEALFDGVWSSAALFMHTPKEFIKPALEGVAHVLAENGIFGVSYVNVAPGTQYNNLRYSRTGEIKYFSRPQSAHIIAAASTVGLRLIEESFSDLDMAGKVKKAFFITQLFQKQ